MIDVNNDANVDRVEHRDSNGNTGFVRVKLQVFETIAVGACWRQDAIEIAERRARFGIWKRVYGEIRDPLARVEAALMAHHPDRFYAEKLIADLKAAIPAAPK